MWVDVGEERVDDYDEGKRTVQATENMVQQRFENWDG
jgi:hypothetical protein